MIRAYLPVLLLMGFVIMNALLIVGISHLTMRQRPNAVKQSSYESGIPALGDARERFSVKFYMVAMLFLIFDVEAVFLYPWAVVFRSLGWFGLAQMAVFLGVLGVAFVYEIGRGGLEWD